MESYDDRDLVQRQIMDSAFPQIKMTKDAMFEASMDQHKFLVKVAMAAPGNLPEGGMSRLISIIGGAERLLVHDVSARIYSSYITDGDAAPLMTQLGNTVLGLVSFVASGVTTDDPDSFKPGVAATRPARTAIAKEVLHHFPALITGRLSATRIIRSKVDNDAPGRLVTMCERVVQENVSDALALNTADQWPLAMPPPRDRLA